MKKWYEQQKMNVSLEIMGLNEEKALKLNFIGSILSSKSYSNMRRKKILGQYFKGETSETILKKSERKK